VVEEYDVEDASQVAAHLYVVL